MPRRKRLISRAKTYGFHPWFDQVDAVDQIVKETGAKESVVLRRLLDEALIARRRQTAEDELKAASAADNPAGDRFGEIENLLVQVLRQNDTSLRVQDLTLALLQDTLAEARAGRKAGWRQAAAALKEEGLNEKQIIQKFTEETEAAKDWSYGEAQEIKRQQS
jgi:hypothetical protein